MTIEIKDGVEYSRMFFFGMERRDVMGMMFREEGKPWTMRYRVRTYADDKAFGSNDRKSWSEFVARPDAVDPCAKMISAIEIMARTLETEFNAECFVVNLEGMTPAQVSDAISRQPWAHVGSTSFFDERGVAAGEA